MVPFRENRNVVFPSLSTDNTAAVQIKTFYVHAFPKLDKKSLVIWKVNHLAHLTLYEPFL